MSYLVFRQGLPQFFRMQGDILMSESSPLGRRSAIRGLERHSGVDSMIRNGEKEIKIWLRLWTMFEFLNW
jgi:hypothetical protein